MRAHDVVIVGAGIIGSTIALRLAQEKLRVALVERNEPGGEASWAAAGMLSPVPDSPGAIPLVPFGRASLDLYPQFIEEIEESSGQRTGYRDEGTIELLFSADAERALSTLVALHHGLGLPTEPLPLDEARRLEPAIGREATAAALLPYESSVEPRALMQAILAATRKSGVEIVSHTAVTGLVTEGRRCTGVIARGKTFQAGHVVLAAGAFSGELHGIAPRVATRPTRGQMVALCSAGVRLRRVIRSERGYLVPRNDAAPQSIVAGSTLEDAGFAKCVTPAGLERILSAAQELAPALGDAEIVETWSGLRPDSPDHLPLLGPGVVEGVTIATGHYRNGILLAPITAKLVREWIIDRRVSMDWGIFNPQRFSLCNQAAT